MSGGFRYSGRKTVARNPVGASYGHESRASRKAVFDPSWSVETSSSAPATPQKRSFSSSHLTNTIEHERTLGDQAVGGSSPFGRATKLLIQRIRLLSSRKLLRTSYVMTSSPLPIHK